MTPEELKARRVQLGLNQTELAALLSVTQNTVSRWEIGTMQIEAPRSVWLDQEMARIEREHKRPRGRPTKKRTAPRQRQAGDGQGEK